MHIQSIGLNLCVCAFVCCVCPVCFPPSPLSSPLQLQVLLMSVYSLGVMLEDPFDTGAAAATDTLSLTEFMHTLAYVSGVCVFGGGGRKEGGGGRVQGWVRRRGGGCGEGQVVPAVNMCWSRDGWHEHRTLTYRCSTCAAPRARADNAISPSLPPSLPPHLWVPCLCALPSRHS